MVRKFFDRELYDKYDRLAKDRATELVKELTGYKFVLQENEKKRGVDLLVYQGEKHVFNIETEVKAVWKEEVFPYDSVNFPERKSKFAELDKPTLFLMFNKDLKNYLLVNNTDLLKSPKEMVRNRYVPYGEYFFQVPLDKVIFNDLKKAIINLKGV